MTYPAYPPRKNNNTGCWLSTVITFCLVILLVIAGLFLPPFDLYNRLFGEEYAILTQPGDTLATDDNGLQIAAAENFASEAFGIQPGIIARQTFEAGTAENADWLPIAQDNLPPGLALQTPVYTLKTNQNAASGTLILSLAQPSGINSDVLDVYGWYSSDTGGRWHFLPAQPVGNRLEVITDAVPDAVAVFQAAPPSTPQVLLAYDVTRILTPEVAQVTTMVAPAGLQPTLSGKITGSLAPGFVTNSTYMVAPVIRNFADPRAVDIETVTAILSNAALRRTHIAELTAITSGSGFDGVWIDYRGLPLEQRANFSLFIQELNSSLNNFGLLLGVVVPAAENTSGIWETGAYDWRAIGANSDFVQINLGINPRWFTPGTNQPVEALLRWTKGEISRYKVLLALSVQSVREIDNTLTPIGYDEGLAGLGNVKIEAPKISATGSIEPGTEIRAYLDGMDALAGVDTVINTPYIDYLNRDASPLARVWLTTGDALRFRMDSTVPFALGGVAFYDLLSDDIADDIISTIANYMTGLPAVPSPADLVLRWRIEGSSGLIGEKTTGINEDLIVTLAAPDGNYAINVVVEGSGQDIESPRTGVQVAQFRPTETPTPLPTATPTALPSPTPTNAPIVPTAPAAGNASGGAAPASNQAAPSGSGFSANRPGSGSIAIGQFEYGGHVTSANSARAIGAMKRAGMTWMKVQIRFYRGNNTVPTDEIAAAHANGFKVLIGTIGNPIEVLGGGDNYLQEFAAWVGNIAAAGADAIEVWNEPNIEREWPEGQISGGAYARMLQMAYGAIKSANPSTIVISGAPAPTGAEAAYPGKVVNDDRFLRDLIAAGGLNWMDCLGVHYNEGIVPPNQTSGDPRSEYYTRYFQSMLNVYSGIVGGQKPLCFTELGYLTPEGYPPLDPYFGWAANVTLGQQAAWLAQAAALSSQSGRVRLMIVWNIDYQYYGADPQAGFAIIRPDGSCPACDALAAAR
jgi:hypothetical protein